MTASVKPPAPTKIYGVVGAFSGDMPTKRFNYPPAPLTVSTNSSSPVPLAPQTDQFKTPGAGTDLRSNGSSGAERAGVGVNLNGIVAARISQAREHQGRPGDSARHGAGLPPRNDGVPVTRGSLVDQRHRRRERW